MIMMNGTSQIKAFASGFASERITRIRPVVL